MMKVAVTIPVVMTARQQEPLERQEYDCQALGIHGSSGRSFQVSVKDVHRSYDNMMLKGNCSDLSSIN